MQNYPKDVEANQNKTNVWKKYVELCLLLRPKGNAYVGFIALQTLLVYLFVFIGLQFVTRMVPLDLCIHTGIFM